MAVWPFGEFAMNTKCLVFSGTLIGAYMYLPCRFDPNWQYSVVLIGFGSYIAMAWYDSLYNCDNKMKKGITYTITGPFKPEVMDGYYQ